MTTPEPHTKGASYLADVKYLKDKLGESRFNEIFATLPPMDKANLERVLPHHWVSIPSMCALTKACAAPLGMSENKLAYALGAHNAEVHLNTIYRLFLKLGPPELLFKSTTSLWKNYYDIGKAEITLNDTGHKIITLSGLGYANAAWCERIFGYIEKGINMSGNKLTDYSHPRCTAKGHPVCDLELWYSK